MNVNGPDLSKLTPQEFAQIIKNLQSPMAQMVPWVRKSVDILIAVVAQQSRTINQQKLGLTEAHKTIAALAKSVGGEIEIPFKLVESLNPSDGFTAARVTTEFGMMMRFKFVEGPPATPMIES